MGLPKLLALVEPHQLAALQRAGLGPQQAVDALLQEARRRHPEREVIRIRQCGDCFEIYSPF